jgi:hypothetical protein
MQVKRFPFESQPEERVAEDDQERNAGRRSRLAD